MFHRFWPTKWVYGNRRHWCSFKATINWLIWNDVELWIYVIEERHFIELWNDVEGYKTNISVFQNFQNFENFQKYVQFFFFSRQFPHKSKFSKNILVCYRAMSHEYVYKISSRYLQKWLRYNIKHVKNRHFHVISGIYRDVTWDDFDLYYGQKAQEMILTDVSDTIHADSLALFALNIDISLVDVTKPDKSKILTLTWPVMSSLTSGSNFWPCTGSSRTGLSNGVWNLEIGPVVWQISGRPFGPPSRMCY